MKQAKQKSNPTDMKQRKEQALINLKKLLLSHGITSIGCRETDTNIPVEYLAFQ